METLTISYQTHFEIWFSNTFDIFQILYIFSTSDFYQMCYGCQNLEIWHIIWVRFCVWANQRTVCCTFKAEIRPQMCCIGLECTEFHTFEAEIIYFFMWCLSANQRTVSAYFQKEKISSGFRPERRPDHMDFAIGDSDNEFEDPYEAKQSQKDIDKFDRNLKSRNGNRPDSDSDWFWHYGTLAVIFHFLIRDHLFDTVCKTYSKLRICCKVQIESRKILNFRQLKQKKCPPKLNLNAGKVTNAKSQTKFHYVL